MAELVARAKMLIRRPAKEVFNAFVQPDLVTKFWLKGTTGPLGQGAQVEWQFMVPGATERVHVTAFDEPRRIAFAWSAGGLGVDIKFVEKHLTPAIVPEMPDTALRPATPADAAGVAACLGEACG